MTEEQADKTEETEEPEPKRDPYEGWLTLDQVCEILGLTAPSISRKATSGELRRAKVGKVYMYDPASIQPSTKMPQADVSAATAAATAGVMRSLSDMVPELIKRNIEMSIAYQEGTLKLINQLTERCAMLEKVNTEMLMSREAYLDGRNDREIAVEQAKWSMSQKERIIAGAAEHAPALLDLAMLLLKKDVPDEKDESDEENRESDA
jgi:hypothetical protein